MKKTVEIPSSHLLLKLYSVSSITGFQFSLKLRSKHENMCAWFVVSDVIM